MKNWKTTLAGAVAAVTQLVMPIISKGEALHAGDWVQAGTLAALGILAADSKPTRRRTLK
jgi:hypothetical protein